MNRTITQATGTLKPTSWDEGPWAEREEAPKLTLARVTNSYAGDVDGEGTSQSLMLYPDDKTAAYFGFERVVGKVRDRSGSFVLKIEGTWEDGTAKTTWSVVPGSGTAELRGLRGEGGFTAGHGEAEISYTLNYYFE